MRQLLEKYKPKETIEIEISSGSNYIKVGLSNKYR